MLIRLGPSDKRRLFLGDCLTIPEHISPQSIQLIYLDPPFLTDRVRQGTKPGLAYEDRWPDHLKTYLPWLQERLEALYPLLSANGSLILHLDYRAVHYAKLQLDGLFGYDHFINEIIWHYTGGGRSKKRFSCKHDTLLWYSKSLNPVFNIDAIRVPYKETSGYAKSGIVSKAGKQYLPNPLGCPMDDVWDLPIINPLAAERVGYPTQKPLLLLERLISALTNPGDTVADFMCGSGTTLVAAEKLKRPWVGCDRSEAAITCVQERFSKTFHLSVKRET